MQNNDANAQLEVRYELCALREIGASDCMEFRIGEGDWPLRLFAVRDGDRVSVFRNCCPHAGMMLNWKPDHFLTKDGSAIICAAHGAMFDKRTGHCFAGPCAGRTLKRYKVELTEGDRILVTVSRDEVAVAD